MAQLNEYKCKCCGYTAYACPEGHGMVMLGELYNFLCKECREIVTEVAFPFGQKAEKIVCPECGSNKLELWNPKDGKCPKCGGKMKNTGDGYMID